MNYQRFLSYLYDYDRGVKRKNVGYVKVDARDGQCKVSISMKIAPPRRPEQLQAYFFVRGNDEILGIPLAEMEVKGTHCELHKTLPASFFEECGFRPAQFGGVYIGEDGGNSLVFASAWDDEPVYVETFRRIDFSGNTDKKMTEETSEKTAEGETAVQIAGGSGNVGVERTPWENLAKNFTKFPIREDGTVIECLKIRPHHLALLPRKYWNEANTSFLLHGYYTWRHIILARRGSEEEYYIGVPGKYRDRERMMAGMCGYTEYLPAGVGVRGPGYWCKRIEL